MICSDFLAKFHFLEKDSRAFQCLFCQNAQRWYLLGGWVRRCCSIWLWVKDQNCAAEGVLYLQRMEGYSATKELYYPKIMVRVKKKPTGRMIRNADRDKSSYKSAAGRCVDRRGLGNFSLKLEGTQLSGTTSGFCVSIICHKDKLKSCQFVLWELQVPAEACSVGRL